MSWRQAVDRWHRAGPDENGQDLLEYALLAALISLAAFGVMSNVGTTVRDVFWNVISVTANSI